MAENKLRFTETPGQSASLPMPSAEDHAKLNTWHALQLLSYPWTVVALGQKPRPGFRRKISTATIPWYDYRISALTAKVWTSLPDTVNPGGVVYFIGKSNNLFRFTPCSQLCQRPNTGLWRGQFLTACLRFRICVFPSICSMRSVTWKTASWSAFLPVPRAMSPAMSLQQPLPYLALNRQPLLLAFDPF
jgi:hypothetical protein